MNPRRTRTRRTLACALSLAAVLAAPSASSARLPSSYVGMLATDVNAYALRGAQWDESFAAMSRLGVGSFRQTFDVARPTTTLDAFVLAAARHRIRIVPLVLDARHYILTPTSQHGLYPPRDIGPLARFAASLARRYGPTGTLWRGPNRRLRRYAMQVFQVWNEPNLPVWWKPRPNPTAYVAMLRVVSRAIHRADRHATIVSAGIPDSKQSRPRNYKQYLTAFLKAGGWRYVDAIGVHAYAPTVKGMGRVLATYRHVLDAHHGRRLKMLISELGWADHGHPNAMVVGSRGQANRIRDAFRLLAKLRRRDRISGVYYFDWRDYQALASNPRGDTWGYHTGLLRADGSGKPSLTAFQRAVRRLLG